MSVRTAPQIADPRMEGAWRTQRTTGPYTSGAVGGDPNRPLTSYQPPMNINPVPANPATYNVNVQQANKNSFMNSLMSPEALAAIGVGGLGFASNMLSSKNDGRERQLDRDLEMRRLLAGIAGDEMNDTRTRQQLYLGSMGMDPVSQSRDLFSANLLRDIAGRGPQNIVPGQGNVNPFTPSEGTMGFLAPSALAENAGRFYGAAGAIDPNQARPNMAAMGFGDAGAAQQTRVDSTINDAAARHASASQARRDALLGQIEGVGGMQNPAQLDPRKQGTSKKRKFFGTLGAIGGVVAAPFTGGASLMAVGPSLQLGYGAGSKTAAIGGLGASIAQGTGAGRDYFSRRPGGR